MSAGWGRQDCISHMPFKLLVSPTTPVCQRQELKNPGSFSAFNQQRHLMESSKFSRFPSCLSSKTSNPSPQLWITLRLGYVHPDELPATSCRNKPIHLVLLVIGGVTYFLWSLSVQPTTHGFLFLLLLCGVQQPSSDPFCTAQSTYLMG